MTINVIRLSFVYRDQQLLERVVQRVRQRAPSATPSALPNPSPNPQKVRASSFGAITYGACAGRIDVHC